MWKKKGNREIVCLWMNVMFSLQFEKYNLKTKNQQIWMKIVDDFKFEFWGIDVSNAIKWIQMLICQSIVPWCPHTHMHWNEIRNCVNEICLQIIIIIMLNKKKKENRFSVHNCEVDAILADELSKNKEKVSFYLVVYWPLGWCVNEWVNAMCFDLGERDSIDSSRSWFLLLCISMYISSLAVFQSDSMKFWINEQTFNRKLSGFFDCK